MRCEVFGEWRDESTCLLEWAAFLREIKKRMKVWGKEGAQRQEKDRRSQKKEAIKEGLSFPLLLSAAWATTAIYILSTDWSKKNKTETNTDHINQRDPVMGGLQRTQSGSTRGMIITLLGGAKNSDSPVISKNLLSTSVLSVLSLELGKKITNKLKTRSPPRGQLFTIQACIWQIWGTEMTMAPLYALVLTFWWLMLR